MARIEILRHDTISHGDAVAAVEFGLNSDIYTFGDDHVINQFAAQGDLLGPIRRIDDAYVLDCHREPKKSHAHVSAKTSASVDDTLALACSDGTFRFLTPKKLIRKEAHEGAVLCVRWAWDGSQLATSGEDGYLKVWSKTGESSQLAKTEQPIFSVAWGPTDDQIAYCTANRIAIRALHVAHKQLVWTAHAQNGGVILSLDWCPVHNTIISGGEDRTYRLWTPAGRSLYTSRQFQYAITETTWSPKGDVFAVGSHNLIVLCDRSGWEKHLVHADSGSILRIRFSPNGLRLAAAGFKASVVVAQIVSRQIKWNNFIATEDGMGKITIQDIMNDATDFVDLRQHQRELSSQQVPLLQHLEMNEKHLVAITQTQISTFDMPYFNSSPPHVIPINISQYNSSSSSQQQSGTSSFSSSAPVVLCILAEKHFLVVATSGANVSGLIFQYDGKSICSVNLSAYFSNVNAISKNAVALNNQFLAVVEGIEGRGVRVFQVQTGRQYGEPIKVEGGISEISLSQNGPESLLAIVDKTRALEVIHIRQNERVNFASVVDSVKWHDSTDMLAIIMEGALSVIIYPLGPFIDKQPVDKFKVTYGINLTPLPPPSINTALGDVKVPSISSSSPSSSSPAGPSSSAIATGEGVIIESFFGRQVCYRRAADGVANWVGIRPYGQLLNEMVRLNKWDEANRLCRYVDDKALWSCLATMAVEGKDLNSVEQAYAALTDMDKVRFFLHVQSIPWPEARNAELALYRHKADEAERILLTANMRRHAIKMNVRLFRWEHALEIALNSTPGSQKSKQKKQNVRKPKVKKEGDEEDDDEDKEDEDGDGEVEGGNDGGPGVASGGVNLIEYAVGLRRRFLEMNKVQESIPAFQRFKDLPVDLSEIKRKLKEEKKKETDEQQKAKQAARKKKVETKGGAKTGGED